METTMVTKGDLDLLVAVYHFYADDGKSPKVNLRTLKCIGGVEGIDSARSIRQMLQRWAPWGMVKIKSDGDEVVFSDWVMEVFLAVSARARSGELFVLRRVCFGYARMSPGKVSVEEKADIQIAPLPLEDFGFKNGEDGVAVQFFDKAEKRGFLMKNATRTRTRFVMDPFMRLTRGLSSEPLDAGVLRSVIGCITKEESVSQPKKDNVPRRRRSSPRRRKRHSAIRFFEAVSAVVGVEVLLSKETWTWVVLTDGRLRTRATSAIGLWERSGLVSVRREKSVRGGRPMIVGITFLHDPRNYTSVDAKRK